MNQLLSLSLTAMVAISLIDASAMAEDWPRWRGANNDDKSGETNLDWSWDDDGPELVFNAEGFGRGYASVSIVDGILYTTGNVDGGEGDGQAVIAADASTGSIMWTTFLTEGNPEHSYPGSRCTPTYDNGKLYVVASSGKIACLDANTGKKVWEKDFKSEWNGKMMSGWGYSESPLVDGDHVLCTPGGDEAMIVCLNKKDGSEVWRSAVPEFTEPELEKTEGKDGAGYSSIVVSNGAGVKQYVQLIGRGVVGVRASDGKFLWGYNQVANEVANIPTSIAQGDYVFATSSYGGGGSVLLHLKKDGDGVSADPVYWLEKRTFNNHHGGMVLQDGYLFGGHNQNQGFPTCLKFDTGEIVWGGDGLRGEGKGSAAILYVDGKIIFRYQDGLVAIIEATPTDYKVVNTFVPVYQEDKSWAHPVVVDGKLYLREQDRLMCYQLKK
ncbi:PQQ-binding-like beta-propeller repeat protein [Rubinisphaera italica]|uniref:Outer membrane biogenesis protein BamB n=1 Tax=Rubinisphaera italica TaxID=2527969 RepID=A0A5C5XIB4_9PLAN|nr:PQQ-binding-like beta-propeller repeat protein [Rubinisphaera italica]TWT62091.1 outer membrane biogenesis protein BamB [Rubinisphaera italica]